MIERQVANPKPEPLPLPREEIHRIETLEQFRQALLRNPFPVIFQSKTDPSSFIKSRPGQGQPSSAAMPDRVADDVGKHPSQHPFMNPDTAPVPGGADKPNDVPSLKAQPHILPPPIETGEPPASAQLYILQQHFILGIPGKRVQQLVHLIRFFPDQMEIFLLFRRHVVTCEQQFQKAPNGS